MGFARHRARLKRERLKRERLKQALLLFYFGSQNEPDYTRLREVSERCPVLFETAPRNEEAPSYEKGLLIMLEMDERTNGRVCSVCLSVCLSYSSSVRSVLELRKLNKV